MRAWVGGGGLNEQRFAPDGVAYLAIADSEYGRFRRFAEDFIRMVGVGIARLCIGGDVARSGWYDDVRGDWIPHYWDYT